MLLEMSAAFAGCMCTAACSKLPQQVPACISFKHRRCAWQTFGFIEHRDFLRLCRCYTHGLAYVACVRRKSWAGLLTQTLHVVVPAGPRPTIRGGHHSPVGKGLCPHSSSTHSMSAMPLDAGELNCGASKGKAMRFAPAPVPKTDAALQALFINLLQLVIVRCWSEQPPTTVH